MSDLTPGLESPLAAQACFRAILAAFSSPGGVGTLPVRLQPPAGLSPAVAAIILTLADAGTGIALPGAEDAGEWLEFHTGARIVPLDQAVFCVAHRRPSLAALRQGTDAAPEDGATLILDCPALDTGRRFRLSGPGLEHPVTVSLPLDGGFLADWQAQRRNAPRGVDMLLCAGLDILALPRSLLIEAG